MRGQKSSVLHLDATGNIARMPEGIKEKRLMYSLVAKHDHEIIKLASMITSEHGIVSQSELLRQDKFFAMEVGMWPLAKAICVDWTWPSFHLILNEWNSTTIDEYLKIMFKFCNDETSVPPADFVFLKVCYAHFMNIVRRTIEKKFSKLSKSKCIKEIEDI